MDYLLGGAVGVSHDVHALHRLRVAHALHVIVAINSPLPAYRDLVDGADLHDDEFLPVGSRPVLAGALFPDNQFAGRDVNIIEGVEGDGLWLSRKVLHAPQTRATVERAIADRRHGVRDGHTHHAGAISERIVADGGDGIRLAIATHGLGNHHIPADTRAAAIHAAHINKGRGGAVVVDIILQTVNNKDTIYLAEILPHFRRLVPLNRLLRHVQHAVLQIHIIKYVIIYGLRLGRQIRHALQAAATLERVFADCRDGVAYGHAPQAAATEERVFAD